MPFARRPRRGPAALRDAQAPVDLVRPLTIVVPGPPDDRARSLLADLHVALGAAADGSEVVFVDAGARHRALRLWWAPWSTPERHRLVDAGRPAVEAGAALVDAAELASGRVVMVVAPDLADPPSQLRRVAAAVLAGDSDVAVLTRAGADTQRRLVRHPLWRRQRRVERALSRSSAIAFRAEARARRGRAARLLVPALAAGSWRRLLDVRYQVVGGSPAAVPEAAEPARVVNLPPLPFPAPS